MEHAEEPEMEDTEEPGSWDCSVTSTPNLLAFVDVCSSLPHAKGCDSGYIWRGAYTGKSLVIRDQIFLNALNCCKSKGMLSQHNQTCSTSHSAVARLTVYRWLLICGYYRRFFLMISVSVCQIVTPFKKYQDHHHHILPYATGHDDLFTLCEVELRQSLSSEARFHKCIRVIRIANWRCLVHVWPP